MTDDKPCKETFYPIEFQSLSNAAALVAKEQKKIVKSLSPTFIVVVHIINKGFYKLKSIRSFIP